MLIVTVLEISRWMLFSILRQGKITLGSGGEVWKNLRIAEVEVINPAAEPLNMMFLGEYAEGSKYL